jgi:hypothetical protein
MRWPTRLGPKGLALYVAFFKENAERSARIQGRFDR